MSTIIRSIPPPSQEQITSAISRQEEIKASLVNSRFTPDEKQIIAKIVQRNESSQNAEKKAPYENFRRLSVPETNGIRKVDVDGVLGHNECGLMLVNVTIHTPGNEEKVTSLVTTDEWIRMLDKQEKRLAELNRQQCPKVMSTRRNAMEQFLSRFSRMT